MDFYSNEVITNLDATPIPAVVGDENILKFLLSGDCRCRIENIKTGNIFTYKIKRNKDKDNMYFVNVDSGIGPIYCGYFYENTGFYDYRKGAKGSLDVSDIRVQALLYVLNNANRLPSYVLVQHLGYCSRCDSILNAPETLSIGLCENCLRIK